MSGCDIDVFSCMSRDACFSRQNYMFRTASDDENSIFCSSSKTNEMICKVVLLYLAFWFWSSEWSRFVPLHMILFRINIQSKWAHKCIHCVWVIFIDTLLDRDIDNVTLKNRLFVVKSMHFVFFLSSSPLINFSFSVSYSTFYLVYVILEYFTCKGTSAIWWVPVMIANDIVMIDRDIVWAKVPLLNALPSTQPLSSLSLLSSFWSVIVSLRTYTQISWGACLYF